MKVLMINGSPHPNGSTAVALKEMDKTFRGVPKGAKYKKY